MFCEHFINLNYFNYFCEHILQKNMKQYISNFNLYSLQEFKAALHAFGVNPTHSEIDYLYKRFDVHRMLPCRQSLSINIFY